MEDITFHLNVVSGVSSMYSGRVRAMSITGSEGELGIRHGHTPLITTIKSGMVSLVDAEGKQDQMYLAGGILEVQPRTNAGDKDYTQAFIKLSEAMAQLKVVELARSRAR